VVYLVPVILLSAAFSLMMKDAHARRYNVLAVGCVNYVVAGIGGVLWAMPRLSEALSPGALLFGCFGGTMYVLTYLFIMVMLDRQGISIATTVIQLAIAVPILVAILV